MLAFFIMFLIVGFLLGFLIDNQQKAFTVIILLSIGWGFVAGPWAIATFLELLLGYFVMQKIKISQKK